VEVDTVTEIEGLEKVTESNTSAYDELRGSVTGKAAETWDAADKAERQLQNLYHRLSEDGELTRAAKSNRAWEAYDAEREGILQKRKKTRELLLQQAAAAERFATPMPEGESVITTNEQKTLLTQNEQSRIRTNLERSEAIGKGTPFSPKTYDILQREYDYGMEIGGVRGGAICRAVADIVRENQGNIDKVVDHHRRLVHRNSLEDAQRAVAQSGLISVRRVAEPPFDNPRGGKKRTAGHTGIPRSGNAVVGGKGTPLFPKRSRPSWK
jgi:hypothetical protein